MFILCGKYNMERLVESADWSAREEVAKEIGMRPEYIAFGYSRIRVPLSRFKDPNFNIYDYIAEKWGIKDYDNLGIYFLRPSSCYEHPVDAWETVVTYFRDKESNAEYPVSEVDLEEAVNIISTSSVHNKCDNTYVQVIVDRNKLTERNKVADMTGADADKLFWKLLLEYEIVELYDDIY